MKTVLATTAILFALAAAPSAYAESDCPADTTAQQMAQLPEKCRSEMDAWVMQQPETGIDVQGEVAVGTVLPENTQFVEVPAYSPYGYVVVNKKRMLVDRKTRAIIKVY